MPGTFHIMGAPGTQLGTQSHTAAYPGLSGPFVTAAVPWINRVDFLLLTLPLWEVAGVSLEDSCLCKTVCSSPSKVIRLVSVLLQGAHSRDSDLEPEEGWVSFKNTFRRQKGSLRASPFPSNSQHRSLPPPTTRGVQFSLQHSNSNPLKKRGQTENGCFYSAPRGSSRGTACFTLKPPPQKMR